MVERTYPRHGTPYSKRKKSTDNDFSSKKSNIKGQYESSSGKGQNGVKGPPARPKCYECHGYGHLANECTNKWKKKNGIQRKDERGTPCQSNKGHNEDAIPQLINLSLVDSLPSQPLYEAPPRNTMTKPHNSMPRLNGISVPTRLPSRLG